MQKSQLTGPPSADALVLRGQSQPSDRAQQRLRRLCVCAVPCPPPACPPPLQCMRAFGRCRRCCRPGLDGSLTQACRARDQALGSVAAGWTRCRFTFRCKAACSAAPADTGPTRAGIRNAAERVLLRGLGKRSVVNLVAAHEVAAMRTLEEALGFRFEELPVDLLHAEGLFGER